MNTKSFRIGGLFSIFLALMLVTGIVSCSKTELIEDGTANEALGGKKPPKNPPPPPTPAPFYFNHCSYPGIVPSMQAGIYSNTSFSMSYVNSPGGSYPAFTSTTVNGIVITAPAGTLNTGSGTIMFTATGTPVQTGYWSVPMSINGSISCNIILTVSNAPASGPTVDPGTTVGSTGVVNFIYKGQAVSYKTVRAKDNKIWLQQNLGSPQVAFHQFDQASYGDLFQWGRWDDGHQLRNSSLTAGGSYFLNPSNIASGYPGFIIGTAPGTRWWGMGTLSDTWSIASVSAVNGKDPCAALGVGWRLPTAAEWQNIAMLEDLFGTLAAFDCNLKLPTAGYRSSDGGYIYSNGDVGYYWTGTAADNGQAKVLFYDDIYNAGISTAYRGEGFPCRCIKE